MIILIIPVLLTFLALLTLTGRTYAAALAADALAHAAARSASLHTDERAAQAAAEQALNESVGTWGRACRRATVALHPTTMGSASAVRAEVACTSHRDDLAILRVQRERTITGQATSVIDVHREEVP
jgi:IS5 family transposase